MGDEPRELNAWLGRVRALLRRYILLNAAWLEGIRDGPAGREVVAFIMGEPGESASSAEDIEALDQFLGSVDAHLPDNAYIGDRFEQLRERLSLNPLACDALWVLLAPEFDNRYLTVYRLLWGDSAQRYCDADFLFSLLSPHGPYRLSGLLEESSDVVRLGLIRSFEVHQANATYYRPSRRLVDFVAGHDTLPRQLTNVVTVSPPIGPPAWRGMDIAGPLREHLSERGPGRRVVVVEAGRRANVDIGVTQIAGAARAPVLCFDLTERVVADASDMPPAEAGAQGAAPSALMRNEGQLLRALLREARLMDAFLHIRGVELLDDLSAQDLRLLVELISYDTQPLVLECDGPLPANLMVALVRVNAVNVLQLPSTQGDQRRVMWEHLLGKRAAAMPEGELDALAAVPCDAVTMEIASAVHRQTNRPLLDVARTLVARSLPRFARRVDVTLGWEDVVLPPEVWQQIEQIRTLSKHYEQVMDTWGLGRKHSGRGIKVLFSGPSGTGKTLTAGLLARDSRCELYQVDVASILSKWVGETEKHLAQLFRDAQSSGGALLFDEADALFRQRSSQGGSGGERFGTQLVNFLLEAIESFDGMIILTTNFESVIDTAFARRLSYHVRFCVPDAEQRAELWRVHMSERLPLADSVDLDRVGEAYEVTGGEIYQAAIRTAVHTLERGGDRVELHDIEQAIISLYVEKGRLPPEPMGNPNN